MLFNSNQRKLRKYAHDFFVAHPEVRLVFVAGSVGKTNAKQAIATVLSRRYRVRMYQGDIDEGYTPAMSILGISNPGADASKKTWEAVLEAARQRVINPSDVDVVVHEVNSTKPGMNAKYAKYLFPNLSVITAVSANNIEVFGNLDGVAAEQLAVANISQTALINRDNIEGKFSAYLTNPQINTFGTGGMAEYRFLEDDYSATNGYSGRFVAPEWNDPVSVNIKYFDEFNLRLVVSAAATGVKFGLSSSEVADGLAALQPAPGRVNVLRGLQGSVIIDDTANNNPLGTTEALRALYRVQSPKRIAVLGEMHHLGEYDKAEHQGLGVMCDSAQLAWLVTVGEKAEKLIAPVARRRGCQVRSFPDAVAAGAFVHSVLEKDSAVLFSGSDQDYLEEGVKMLLHDASDTRKLVRQSAEWMSVKSEVFSRF